MAIQQCAAQHAYKLQEIQAPIQSQGTVASDSRGEDSTKSRQSDDDLLVNVLVDSHQTSSALKQIARQCGFLKRNGIQVRVVIRGLTLDGKRHRDATAPLPEQLSLDCTERDRQLAQLECFVDAVGGYEIDPNCFLKTQRIMKKHDASFGIPTFIFERAGKEAFVIGGSLNSAFSSLLQAERDNNRNDFLKGLEDFLEDFLQETL